MKELLPHVGVGERCFTKKTFFVGYMTHKLLQLALGRRDPDDRCRLPSHHFDPWRCYVYFSSFSWKMRIFRVSCVVGVRPGICIQGLRRQQALWNVRPADGCNVPSLPAEDDQGNATRNAEGLSVAMLVHCHLVLFLSYFLDLFTQDWTVLFPRIHLICFLLECPKIVVFFSPPTAMQRAISLNQHCGAFLFADSQQWPRDTRQAIHSTLC